MIDRETIRLITALAEAPARSAAAADLAASVGALAMFVLVQDPGVDALVPAPRGPRSVVGGPTWRALFQQCRREGFHHSVVAYPSLDTVVPAVACSGSGIVLVFVGCHCAPETLEGIRLMLPLLASTLRAEQAMSVASGDLSVARQDARHAHDLARSLDTARAELERQSKSLMDARRRAEDATLSKDEFLAMLGHELRNPLAPMVTALQLLRLRGTASRELDILERQVAQLKRLVDDLLDVSRITRGQVELRKEHVELAVIATRAIEMARPLLEQKQQTLTVAIAPVGLAVDGDPDRLAQVFANLLTNAAKYSEMNTHVTFCAERQGDIAVLRIIDEGVGIEHAELETIFNRFVQQRQSLDRSQGGLGLGLTIVKTLVTMHGGTVRASSAGTGAGSELIVELPLSTADPTALSAAPIGRARRRTGSEHAAATSKRILVVDDNEDAADMLSEVLTATGWDVRTAADGPSALVAAQEFQPHIALLDIGLPVMDGYELAERLRAAGSDTRLRLVALTGYGRQSDKIRSHEAGFDAHLLKPVDLADLQRLLVSFDCSP